MRFISSFSAPAYRVIAFARYFLRRCNDINIPVISSGLTFTTLLAIVPLLTVTVVVINAFPMFSGAADKFNDFITGVLVPAAGADKVSEYLLQFRAQAGSLTAIGIVMMMVTSLLLIQTIERTFNRIWQVRSSRPVVVRITVYWTLLTLGPLVLGLGLSTLGSFMDKHASAAAYPVLLLLLKPVLTVLIFAALLFLMFKTVPYCFVPSKHALAGAVVTAVCLEVARRGFAYYVGNFNSYQPVYGAFAAIPVFLLWLNLLWMILLGGALLTASFSALENGVYAQAVGQQNRLDGAVKILLLLQKAQEKGETVSLADMRRQIPLATADLENLAEALAVDHLVAASGRGWLLKTAPGDISMARLFDLFVYHASSDEDDDVSRKLADLVQKGLGASGMTLSDFSDLFDSRQSPAGGDGNAGINTVVQVQTENRS